ncbi:S8 family peptidase [Clostridium sp. C2-6-12]|uniref:S8 family peptidase n=1 Tax=Clostridium sp. C2-6-12 TaxID=2698832 RepID=UPI00136974AF|nr:S8 family peptidase [Clostridium sp. C2-6-12]
MKKFFVSVIGFVMIFALSFDLINSYMGNYFHNNYSVKADSLEKISLSNNIRGFFRQIGIGRNYNGGYVIVIGNVSHDDLMNQIKDIENKEKEPPKNVQIIKPIDRTTVNNDFALKDVEKNNNVTVNDPGYKYQWYIPYTKSDKAWSLVNQKREIKVAVLDTGVDYTHPDLRNKVLFDEGYNFVGNNRNVMDYDGHGTHVSGIIAAEANNSIGLAGVTGNLDVKILPIKVLNADGEGDTTSIVKGILYAVDSGADIINLSLGARYKIDLLGEAIEYAKSKGVFVVTASGNDNENSDNFSPAGDGGYTVAAMNYNYKKASFSDYGNSVKAAAPGVKILSTVPGGYEAWDGTSMAAPVVSGIAAMLKAEKPDLTPAQLEQVLNSTATDIMYKGKDQATGYGLVNAYEAVKKVKTMENN